jgi:guanylate kinase
MIVLLCGPSGGGKTTLLRQISRHTNCKVICVTVARVDSRRMAEPGRIDVSQEAFECPSVPYNHTYRYHGSVYGVSYDETDISGEDYVFLDYPGEYPACSELSHIRWRGILVLPPSADILRSRLLYENRDDRIESAQHEYEECNAELARGLYPSDQWHIYVSSDNQSVVDIVKHIATRSLFV